MRGTQKICPGSRWMGEQIMDGKIFAHKLRLCSFILQNHLDKKFREWKNYFPIETAGWCSRLWYEAPIINQSSEISKRNQQNHRNFNDKMSMGFCFGLMRSGKLSLARSSYVVQRVDENFHKYVHNFMPNVWLCWWLMFLRGLQWNFSSKGWIISM